MEFNDPHKHAHSAYKFQTDSAVDIRGSLQILYTAACQAVYPICRSAAFMYNYCYSGLHTQSNVSNIRL